MTNGWQVSKLYDISAGVFAERGDGAAVLDLRRQQHERAPTSSTYSLLQKAANAVDTWPSERARAREVLGARDPGGLIDALLADGDIDTAWETATAPGATGMNDQRWGRLAEAREPDDPAGALRVYIRLVEPTLERADKRNYRVAVKQLKAARQAAEAAGLPEEFDEHLAALREQHRRRPTLIEMLDRAKLG